MRQLARIVLAEGSSSADEQIASPDEAGDYGELVEEIDRIAGQAKHPKKTQSDP